MSEGDTERELTTTVHEVICELGPVKWQRVAVVTYDGDISCDDCGRLKTDFEEHQQRVKSAVLKLANQNRIYPNAEWEYRSRNTEGERDV